MKIPPLLSSPSRNAAAALLVVAFLFSLAALRADDGDGTVTGGTLVISNNVLTGTGTTTIGTANLTTDGGGLLKIGQGTLVLSNPTFSDPSTQVNATLTLENTLPSNVIFTTGGTLNVGGYLGTTAGSVVMTTGAMLQLTNTSTLTLNGSTNTLGLTNTNLGAGNLVLTAGTLPLLRTGNLTQLTVNATVGATLNSLPAVVNSVSGTLTRFLDGTLTVNSDVSMLYLPALLHLASNPLELHMTNGGDHDKFVLQISYDPAQAAGLGDLNKLYLAWFDPVQNLWRNAVDANSDGGAARVFVNGSYSSATDFNLGTYGVDTANHVVWAVIDHNSTFGVANSDLQPEPAPEPAAAVLMVLGGCAVLLRRRRVA